LKNLNLDWHELKTNNKSISIIEYIEQNEDLYKRKYFEQIEKIGYYKLTKDKNIFQECQYKLTYNLWQMSSIMEKSFFKTPKIFEHIKLIALLDIINSKKPDQVNIVGCNVETAGLLTSLKKSTTFKFENIINDSKATCIYKSIKKNLRFEALLWLSNQFFKKIKSPRIRKKRKQENSIFIMDYFVHLNFIKNKPSFYSSNIWEPLLKKLPKNHSIYFLHHFIPTKKIKSISKAAKKVNDFNLHKNQFHNFLDLNLNLIIFFKAFFNFILFQLKTKKIISSLKKETLNEHNSIKFKFLKNFFKKSLTGKELMQNILYIELFDDFFKKIEHQKTGIYLQENQGWEFAFINAWKKYRHGKLFAFNSASISNWDLRYLYPFDNKKISLIKQKLPDKFLVGSKHYKKLYTKYGYKKNNVLEVEALRYLKHSKKLDKLPKGKILIMGSITKSENAFMIDTIRPLFLKLNQYKWYFKSHPASTYIINDKNIKLITTDLNEIAKGLDFVICPSDSSVAIDCYFLRLNFLILLKKGVPNTSPLKNIDGIKFAYNTNDITKLILTKHQKSIKEDFFSLDQNLKNWNLILQENQI
tara:strand:+ start:376 stop:2130 length:1755 start_codon:yes stop_codon:yes gene_type:complete